MNSITRREAVCLLAGSLSTIASLGLLGCSGSSSGNEGDSSQSKKKDSKGFGISSEKPITVKEAFSGHDAYWFYVYLSSEAELLSKRTISPEIIHISNDGIKVWVSSVVLGDIAAAKDEDELQQLIEAGLVANGDVTTANDPEGWDEAKPLFALLSPDLDLFAASRDSITRESVEFTSIKCVAENYSGEFKSFWNFHETEVFPVTEIEGKHFAGFRCLKQEMLLTVVNKDFPGFDLDQLGADGVEDFTSFRSSSELNEKIEELGYTV